MYFEQLHICRVGMERESRKGSNFNVFPLPTEQVIQKSAVRPNDFWSRARKFCGPPKINTEQKLNGAQSAAENLLNILSANHSLGHHQVDTIT